MIDETERQRATAEKERLIKLYNVHIEVSGIEYENWRHWSAFVRDYTPLGGCIFYASGDTPLEALQRAEERLKERQ